MSNDAGSVKRLCTPTRIPGVGSGLYFSNFMPFGNPRNARETVDNTLFYSSAGRFDVFTSFSSQMSTKPAVIRESLRRIDLNLQSRPSVVMKEFGTGHGESTAIILEEMRQNHLDLYGKVLLSASDGYLPMVEKLRTSERLLPFIRDGKLNIYQEDMMGQPNSNRIADYARISYTLMELPEDFIRKEEEKLLMGQVRGYLIGTDAFKSDAGIDVPAETIADMLSRGDIGGILGLGLDTRSIYGRVGYDVTYLPIDYAQWPEGDLIRRVLSTITSGISDTNFRMGLNAARAVENILEVHLKPDKGSFLEAFDVWTKDLLPGMPTPLRQLNFKTISSANYPFVAEYLRQRGITVDISFEDWQRYIGLNEPYISCSQFAKWLKAPENSGVLKEMGIDDEAAGSMVEFISKYTADVVLNSERDSHPVIRMLKSSGFTDPDIEEFFASGQFPEPVKSQSHGYYGIYQVATFRR